MDKKIISIILTISLIFGLAAPTLGEGEEVPEGNLEIDFKLDKDIYNLDEYITGTGKLKLNDKGVKDAEVTLLVEDLETGLSIYAIEQYTTDVNGRFNVKFKMLSNISEGMYKLKLKSSNVSKTCVFTIGDGSQEIKLTSIKIQSDKTKIKKGASLQLKLTGTMSDGSSAPNSELEGVKWSSSDEGIAKVNSAGLVTGIKKGTAVITAAIGDIKDTISIEVYKKHSGGGSSNSNKNEKTKSTDVGEATIVKDEDGNITVELEVDTNKLKSQIKDTSKNAIIIDANIKKDADEIIVNMDSELLSKASENNKKLVINTGSAVIEIEPDSIMVTKDEKIKLLVTNLDDKKTSKLISKKDSGEYQVVSPIYDFDLLVDNSHKTFNKPVIIKLKYDKRKVEDIRKLGAYYYNEKTKEWEYIGGKGNKDGTIEFSVNHFGKYTAMMYNKVFADVDMSWAKDAIEVLTARHIIDGIGGNKYDPNGNITRAQFAKLLVYALDLKSGNENLDFIDVQSGAWYEESVNIAGSLGIVTGYDGKFNPDGQITREAMATMIVRALKYVDSNGSYIASNTNFADQDNISEWAKDSVSIAFNKGLVSGIGNNKFAPKQNATRAQAGVMIYRLLEVLDLL